MIPTNLNLLSPEKKKNLKKILYFQYLKDVFQTALAVTCCVAIVLLGGRSVLQEFTAELTSEIVSVNLKNADINKKIKKINQTLRMASETQKNFLLWSDIMNNFSLSVPDGVILNAVDLNAAAKKLTISGSADNRESLLDFQNRLEKMDIVSNVQVPLSSLTEKTDLPFSLTAEFSPAPL